MGMVIVKPEDLIKIGELKLPELPIPPEPKGLKEEAKKKRAEDPSIKLDSLYVWFGNRLPKIFWDCWKEKLKPLGITWQKFLRIMSLCKRDILLWLRDEKSWKELVEDVKDTLSKFGNII